METDRYLAAYRSAKARYPDVVLLMRIGDFYESFGDDALVMGRVLGLTVSQRGGVAMAGIPYHQLEAYLKRLVERGSRVAVMDYAKDSAA